MYTCDGVVTLRESPSTIYSLDLVLVLISRLLMNELRVATNRLRLSYNVQECIRNLLRIEHDFSNQGIRG